MELVFRIVGGGIFALPDDVPDCSTYADCEKDAVKRAVRHIQSRSGYYAHVKIASKASLAAILLPLL